MKCFEDYIGIKWCNSQTDEATEPDTDPETEATEDTPSFSGTYINQLPGISVNVIESIANNEQVNFKGVWKDIQTRSLRRFERDYLREFTKRYVGHCCTTEECDPKNIACAHKALFIDVLNFILGNELMIEVLYSSRINASNTVDREKTEELKDYYQVEYERALIDAIDSIPTDIIQNCFVCEGRIYRAESLP